MNINVKYFGMLSDLTGKREETIQVDEGADIVVLKSILSEKYETLKKFEFNLAINLQVISEDKLLLSDNDEAALLPPYAGG